MGVYHYRCLASGISLRMADAVCVFVQRVGDGWRPASLPMRGSYNCYGTIDAETGTEFHARQVVKTFEDGVKGKQIVLGGDSRSTWKDGEGMQRIVDAVERSPDNGSVKFGDGQIAHTLFQAPVWDAICAAAATSAGLDVLAPFGRWWYEELARFPRADVREWLYGGLAQVAAVDAWLTAHDLRWSTPSVFEAPGEQHGARQILESVRAARRRFAGTPLEAGVQEAAQKIEDFPWEPPSGWITNIDVSWYALALGKDRCACTSADQILPRIEAAIAEPSDLVGEPLELLAVDRGDVVARFDLRQFLRIRAGARSVALADPAACEQLLTEPELDCQLELAPLELPPLRAPLADGSEALLIVPEPAPAWITDDEQYATVIPFDFE